MVGQTISHYKILAKLGGGGMGVVYKAEDIKLKRPVALKFLPLGLTRDDEAKERFVHEAQAASALDHPNICTIYEIDETTEGQADDGQLFIAMAYYEGETLKKKIERGPLPIDQALDFATQISQGLARAHEAGITHRDIKPANVMVTNRGEVKIVGFGLAKLAGRTKLTKSGTTLGTVAYMSPEQAQGAEVDHRTDIWSLGVVLYEMLTGQLPFQAEYEQAVIYGIVNLEPEPVTKRRSEVPVALEQIVKKTLAKKLDERYQQMDELLTDLRALKSGTVERRPSRITSPRRMSAYVYRGLAALVVLLGVIGIYFWKTTEVEAKQVAIAVLPLKSIAEVPDQDWFTEGMTDALITDLAKIGGMRVISRSSSMQYKGTNKPIPEIARALHVDYVIDGSVLKVGNQIRISAQLINAPKDEHLWADSYEREISNILALQGEIAQVIANQVRVKLTPQEQKRLSSSHPVNPDAQEAYLKGLFYLHQLTQEGVKKSLEYFQQAISKDPNYALPYAGLSEAYSLSGIGFRNETSPDAVLSQAREAAFKALRIDSTLSDVHTALGEISLFFDHNWREAEERLQKAIQLNPSNAAAHRWYALYLSAMARHEEAIAASKRAYQLDPLSPLTGEFVGLTYYFARLYDQAIKEYQNLLELHPNFGHGHYLLGFAYKEKKMDKEAIDALNKSIALNNKNDHNLAGLGNALAVSGHRSEAMKILEELLTQAKQRYVQSQEISLVYMGLGDKDKAFEFLEKAYQEKTAGSILLLKVAPWLDPLRSDPRFTALMKNVGLEQ
jgi:serine/threonine-protein kinase